MNLGVWRSLYVFYDYVSQDNILLVAKLHYLWVPQRWRSMQWWYHVQKGVKPRFGGDRRVMRILARKNYCTSWNRNWTTKKGVEDRLGMDQTESINQSARGRLKADWDKELCRWAACFPPEHGVNLVTREDIPEGGLSSAQLVLSLSKRRVKLRRKWSWCITELSSCHL